MAESLSRPSTGVQPRPAGSNQIIDWLEQWRSATASRPSDPCPGLGPACHAILLLAGLGELDAVPLVSRQAWGALIQACQKPGNELFEELAAGKPVRAHLLSSLAMQALIEAKLSTELGCDNGLPPTGAALAQNKSLPLRRRHQPRRRLRPSLPAPMDLPCRLATGLDA